MFMILVVVLVVDVVADVGAEMVLGLGDDGDDGDAGKGGYNGVIICSCFGGGVLILG